VGGRLHECDKRTIIAEIDKSKREAEKIIGLVLPTKQINVENKNKGS
jgi:hypothetical protein